MRRLAVHCMDAAASMCPDREEEPAENTPLVRDRAQAGSTAGDAAAGAGQTQNNDLEVPGSGLDGSHPL